MRAGIVAALLLAAGESSRMGRAKPLLPWFGTTLVAYQVNQLLQAGVGSVIVVLGHQAETVQVALRGFPEVTLVTNPAYQQGRSTSIRAGVEALPEGIDSILLHCVDHPRRAETLRRLISTHQEGSSLITAPAYRGRRGHPPVLSASLRAELSSVTEEHQGLREIMHRHLGDTLEVSLDTAEVLLNLNTPEDYRRALAFFQERS